MACRLMHPKHGWAFAYNDAEEKTMRENGWIDDVTVEPEKPEKEHNKLTHRHKK